MKKGLIIIVVLLLVWAMVCNCYADNSKRIAELQAQIMQIQAQRYEIDKQARDNLSQLVGGIKELQRLDQIEAQRAAEEKRKIREEKEKSEVPEKKL